MFFRFVRPLYGCACRALAIFSQVLSSSSTVTICSSWVSLSVVIGAAVFSYAEALRAPASFAATNHALKAQTKVPTASTATNMYFAK